MPLLHLTPCLGTVSRRCKFSTSTIGKPYSCASPDVRCVFCSDSALPRNPNATARSLSLLYILDANIYREALATLPIGQQESYRTLVRMQLGSMGPHGPISLLSARRERVIVAVGSLVQSVTDVRSLLPTLKTSARDLVHALTIKSKIRNDSLTHLLSYIVPGTSTVLQKLEETRKSAYSLARHPLFAKDIDDGSEIHLANAYINSIVLHRASLRDIEAVIDGHLRIERLFVPLPHARDLRALAGLVARVLREPVLLRPRLCHAEFHPTEAP